MPLLVVKDGASDVVALGLNVNAVDEVVDDVRLLGWRRCIEATAKSMEEPGEAEALSQVMARRLEPVVLQEAGQVANGLPGNRRCFAAEAEAA